jgi:Kef-type K+ transport system membrane component KefB
MTLAHPALSRRLTGHQLTAYGLLVVLPAIGTLAILRAGAHLPRPLAAQSPAAAITPAAQATLRVPLFLTQIIVIIVVARLLSFLLRRLGQPGVVGEMVAGLLLGRSFLGVVAPATYAWLFPIGTGRFLNALSQFGLVLFMFLVGLELERPPQGDRRGSLAVVAHASIAIPMILGTGLALALYERFATSVASFPSFALFLGCALSVTAFPVLARILRERRLMTTEFGGTAMACAAFADVTAWIVLAFVLAVTGKSSAGSIPMAATLAGTVLFMILMVVVLRPLLRRWWAGRAGADLADPLEHREGVLSVMLLVVLLSALATEFLGIQALFGAFVAGAVMPREAALRRAIRVRFEDALSILLLPVFFAFAGLRADLSAVRNVADWGVCLLIIAVAVTGKIGGATVAARSTGTAWRESAALGVLMNTRGLMELILLTIGLRAGIITPLLFSLMLVMAIVTTMMTTPLLAALVPRVRVAAEPGAYRLPTQP